MMEKRSAQTRRIRGLLWLVVLSIFLSVGLSAYLFTQIVVELNSQGQHETSQLLELEDAVSDAMSELSGQTQEWKDMLLRAHDPALFSKHKQNFEMHAQALKIELAEVQKKAQILGLDGSNIAVYSRSHQTLMEDYHAALALYDAKNHLSYRLVDAQVRGKDRFLRDSLNEEREKLAAQIELSNLAKQQKGGQGVWAQHFLELGGVALLLPLVSLIAFIFAYRALRQLGQSDARIRAIYEAIGDAVVVADTQGCVVQINAPAQRLMGYSQADAQGKPLREVFPIYNARTGERTNSPAENVLCYGKAIPVANGMLLRRPDDSELPIEDSAMPILDAHGQISGVVMVFHDVSKRYEMMAELERERALFQQTFNLAAVGMAHLGMDGRWRRVNRKLCEITGYSEGELLSLSWQGVTHPDYLAGDEAQLRALASKHIDSYCTEKRYIRKDGQEIWISLTVSIVWKADGTPDYGISIIEDIHARKEAEQFAAQSQKQYQALFEQMPEGVVLLNQQLKVISHNHEAEKILEYSGDELLTLNLRDFKASGSIEEDERRKEKIAEFGRDDFESIYRTKSGHHINVDVSVQVVKLINGEPVFQTLFRDISSQKQAAAQIEHLAYHDQLTGLANRRLLQDRMNQAISSVLRRQGKIAVLFLDIDHFKDVNDSFGHQAGDRLLQIISTRLLTVLRNEDTLARVGGDEFVIMLNDVVDENDVATVAEKIQHELVKPIQLEQEELHVTPSIGISLCPQDGRDTDELLKHADAALYHAKRAGRATYRFYTQQLHEQTLERLKLERLLRNALERNEFELYYQPQIDLETGFIVGCEALIRWNHPSMGQVSPASFIPVAEHTNLIIPIGDWVMHEACRQAKIWHDEGWEIKVSFNVSARQFLRPLELMQGLRLALKDSGVNPELMEIELTESLLLDEQSMSNLLNEIRALGVHLALDDFGTGYSSLSYLRRFPIGVLKIDQSFVGKAHQSKEDVEMIKTIIGMAHNLRMTLVAEGVETEEQRALLAIQGCEVGQGYHYSRPVPVAEFEKLLGK